MADLQGGAMAPLEPALHVARRFTWGPTSALLDEIRIRGVHGWLDEQLAASPDATVGDDPALGPALAALPTLGMPGSEIAGLGDEGGRPGVRGELATATILRAWLAGAQLREVMVDLWWNHFNVEVAAVPLGWAAIYDRDAIRPHALGRVADLLGAVTHSPAMLAYLDNAGSVATGGRVPNENHARELLELHTVGRDGGYDETDVGEVAHLLSGWTVRGRDVSFVFDAGRHDLGPLASGEVLGWRPPVGLPSLQQGEDFLDHLAHSAAMARHVAWKLALRFVADDVRPDSDLVRDLAEVYLDADTAIAPVLRHLVDSDAFRGGLDPPTKVRRPLDFLVASLRGLGARPGTDLVGLRKTLASMSARLGQVPHAWPPPDGYPDVASVWISPGGLITRWQVAAQLVSGAPGIDVPALAIDPPSAVAVVAEGVRRSLTGASPDDGSVEALVAALGVDAETPAVEIDPVVLGDLRSLVLSSAEFQLR